MRYRNKKLQLIHVPVFFFIFLLSRMGPLFTNFLLVGCNVTNVILCEYIVISNLVVCKDNKDSFTVDV